MSEHLNINIPWNNRHQTPIQENQEISNNQSHPNTNYRSSLYGSLRYRLPQSAAEVENNNHNEEGNLPPPGGWNSIDRFAQSYSRSQTFYRIDPSNYNYDHTEDDSAIQEDDSESPDHQPQDEDDHHAGIYHSPATIGRKIRHNISHSTLRRTSLVPTIRRLSYAPSEHEPLLRAILDQDGEVEKVTIVGQSTLYQTVFNSVNILIGIGILSLPLGIRYAGWIPGLSFLAFTGLVCLYTSRVIAKCLDADPTAITYSDMMYLAFGHNARIIVSIVFCLELVAACVALVAVFGDSLEVLVTSATSTDFKILGFFIFLPLAFVPLSILSYSSIIGIISTTALIAAVIADGLIRKTSPGSLLRPEQTDLWPTNFRALPLAIGVLMSPWSGHAIFPNVYRDMRHPAKFGKAMGATFSITFLLDLSMGVVGYIMYGRGVSPEITHDILNTNGTPTVLNYIVVSLIAIVPITKMPLNTRPISTTLEVIFGLDDRVATIQISGISPLNRTLSKIAVQVLVNLVPVIIAIIFPAFDRIVAIMGAAFAMSISILIPILCYLKIYKGRIPTWEIVMDVVLFVICLCMAVLGSVWAFLPREFYY